MTQRTRLPVLVRCQHLLHDEQHRYTCLALQGKPCEPIQRGPDLSACPQFKGPGPQGIAKPRKPDDEDLAEYCPCAGKT